MCIRYTYTIFEFLNYNTQLHFSSTHFFVLYCTKKKIIDFNE